MNLRAFGISLCLAVAPSLAAADNVVTYHNSADRHGVYVMPGLTSAAAARLHLDQAFHASFSGHVYAQPLFWHPAGGRALVIVATESNSIVALDATTGTTVWQKTYGAPVPLKELPCGNIDPDGITGTPVIDSFGRLYFDALTKTALGPRHLIYTISPVDGAAVSKSPIDVEALLSKRGMHFESAPQGERSALNLVDGDLYVNYGGKFGDCGNYRGTVVEIHTWDPNGRIQDPTSKPRPGVELIVITASLRVPVWQTRAKGGGIWAQGGLASDGQSLFATTGNTFDAQGFADGEAIIRLKAGLARSSSNADFFTPSNWKQLDDEDQDLGGTEALPFNVGDAKRVIAFGKDGNAYLVDRDNLGGIGGALAVVKESDHAIITAPAVLETPNAAMIAFGNRGGCGTNTITITMLKVTAAKSSPISTAWCGAMLGRGSPIITTTDGKSNAVVWAAGAEGDNLLHGFDASDGHVVFNGGNTPMAGLHHFQTLIAAEGKLYVAADDRVYAFAFGR